MNKSPCDEIADPWVAERRQSNVSRLIVALVDRMNMMEL